MLTADQINPQKIMLMAGPTLARKGREYHTEGRVTVKQVGEHDAIVLVQGSQPGPYTVSFTLSGQWLQQRCNCAFANNVLGVACKHVVAAALGLHDYLVAHPPSPWKRVLGSLPQPQQRRAARNLLLFSMQKGGQQWNIVTYMLPARVLPPEALRDDDALDEALQQQEIIAQARIPNTIDKRSVPDATHEAVAAASLLLNLLSSWAYTYYAGNQMALSESLFTLLPHCVLYEGTTRKPFRSRIAVELERAIVTLNLNSDDDDLVVSPTLQLRDEAISPVQKGFQIVDPKNSWALYKGSLFRYSDPAGLLQAFGGHGALRIPEYDQRDFITQVLAPVAEQVPIAGPAMGDQELSSDPQPRLYLSEHHGELQVELRLAYDVYEVAYNPNAGPWALLRHPHLPSIVQVKRNLQREEELWRSLSSYGLKRGQVQSVATLRKGTTILDFLTRRVPELSAAGYEIYGEETLSSARINRHMPTIRLNVSTGIDWFDVQAVVQFGDATASLKDLRRALRRRERFVRLNDGSLGQLPEEWITRYRHLFAIGEEREGELRLAQHHVALLDALLSEDESASADAEFARRREQLTSFSSIQRHELPHGLHGQLRGYQHAGYNWLHFLHEYGFGGCLADDMGVGKTLQALAFLLSIREGEHATAPDLIVLPRSLIFNWEREAAKWTPSLRILVHTDQGRAADPSIFEHYDLVLTTYGTMLRDIEMLRQCHFHYVLLDEAQAIKNPGALTSRAARLLRCDHRLALTGTPVENSTLELWSLFAFLNPGLLGNLEYFRETFATPIERHQDEETALLLRKLVYPFILRRTKAQVAPELPPRDERTIFNDMEPAQRKLYNQVRDYYRAQLLGMIEQGGMDQARMHVLEGLLRLRQICNHPQLADAKSKADSAKLEQLLETLDTLRSEGHKALIFSQFVQMLSIVREELDRRGVPYAYLDGQTRDREGQVDRFQQEEALPFFLISLRAGGVGLNLTAADYVIHIDPWWNPAVEMQATDRTHRIGQDKPVFVYRLITRDSVEEKIMRLQEQKRSLVEQLISTEGGIVKSLTREDIEVLFS